MNPLEILGLIGEMNKAARSCAELRARAASSAPEEKTLCAVLDRLFAQERDNIAALMHLFNVMTKEKPAAGMMDFVRETLAANREASKIIK